MTRKSEHTRTKAVEDLQNAGIEVIYDDRSVRAGVSFADADAFGIPLRIIVSPKNETGRCRGCISHDKILENTDSAGKCNGREIKQYL